MMCPKCHQPNPTGSKECDHCGVIFKHIRGTKKEAPPLEEPRCAYVSRGIQCEAEGSCVDGGKRFCSDHYWHEIKGFSRPKPGAPYVSYRERWYAERGLPYEPPTIVHCPPFQSIGRYIPQQAIRQREPGDDDETLDAQGNPV